MVIDFRQIGRLHPKDLKEDQVFYHCWAGMSVKYQLVGKPNEVRPGKWEWEAQNIQYPDLVTEKSKLTRFEFSDKNTLNNPYIFDWPAYIPVDSNDQNLIY